MKNWRTSIPGIFAALLAAGSFFGAVPPEQQNAVLQLALAILGGGLVAAKDHNK